MSLLAKSRIGFGRLAATGLIGWASAGLALPAPAEFEVASIKQIEESLAPGSSDLAFVGTSGKPFKIAGNRVTINGTFRTLMAAAYNVKDYQVSGAPDWASSLRYTITAETAGGSMPTQDEVRPMLQALLAERFKLATHREQKEMSYFALVPAKNGPKVQRVQDVPDGFRGITCGGRINSILQMPALAYLLSRFERERPIIDRTGLSGMYEVKLQWTLQQLQNPDAAPGPSLFTALNEQLGLKLEARKGPVEILVVDRAEKVPAEN